MVCSYSQPCDLLDITLYIIRRNLFASFCRRSEGITWMNKNHSVATNEDRPVQSG